MATATTLPRRSPGIVTFALVAFAISCLLSLALDWSSIRELPNPVGSLIGAAFPAVLVSLAVAAISFHDPKGRRSLVWRALPAATALGLLRALQFAAGLAPVTAREGALAALGWIGGTGVLLAGAGLTLLAMFAARSALARYDRAAAARDPKRSVSVLGYPQFALTLVPTALLISELLTGSALPSPHWLSLASVTALPLGFGLLAGIAGFYRAPPERPLRRRITPGLAAYCLAWLVRGSWSSLGGGPWAIALAILTGLATSFIIATLTSVALFAVQGVIRLLAARSGKLAA
jgi:hypothetical protein